MRIERVFLLFFTLIPLFASIGFSRERILFSLGEKVTPPKSISTPSPPFTAEALKAGENDIILRLEAVVTVTGRVRDITIIRGLGHGLNESASETLTKHWLFEPATYKGQPVEVKMSVDVCFHLDDGYAEEPADINRLRFLGHTLFTEDQLRRTVQEKLKALSGSIRKDYINDYIVEALLERYQAYGYIKVQFRWLPNNILHIREGQQFHIGQLEIRNATVFSVGQLLALLGLKKGDVADYSKVRAGVEKIRQLYVSAGLSNWNYLPEQTFDDEKGVINITFLFEESKH